MTKHTDTCEYGHWSSHRHCQVKGCGYVEKLGGGMGAQSCFVEGYFVCRLHGMEAAAILAATDKPATMIQLESFPVLDGAES